jgi:hypothetical protein
MALCLTIASPARADNVVLITADEAKLPPPKGAVALKARGITRGPKIELVSQKSAIRSPTRIRLKFYTYGGASVDLNAVKATYLRTPDVDLTSRLKPFISGDGIDVPAAEMPAGDHMLRIDLKDSDGRTATAIFLLKVED